MRILYINSFLGRYDFWTGERGRQLVEALRDCGAQVTTIPGYSAPEAQSSEGGSSSASEQSPSGLKRFIKEVLPRWLTDLIIESFMVARGLAKTVATTGHILLNRKKYDCDVVLARTFEYEWTPALVAAILNRPLVLEIHAPLYKERLLRGGSESTFFRRLEAAMWKKAGGLWVHTHELKRIVSEDADEAKIEIIPWGVPQPAATQSARSLPEDIVNIIFVGSFYGWHGILDLIDAYAKVREQADNVHLTLVGDGIERGNCEARLSELGLTQHTTLTGWLPKEHVSEHLLAGDIGVAPYSRIENFYFEPVKVLDYMAHGLAIVASNQGQINKMIEDQRDGILVEPGDVDALAAALLKLVKDAAKRAEFGGNAKSKAPTWAQTARAVHTLCSKAIENMPRSSALDEPGVGTRTDEGLSANK